MLVDTEAAFSVCILACHSFGTSDLPFVKDNKICRGGQNKQKSLLPCESSHLPIMKQSEVTNDLRRGKTEFAAGHMLSVRLCPIGSCDFRTTECAGTAFVPMLIF